MKLFNSVSTCKRCGLHKENGRLCKCDDRRKEEEEPMLTELERLDWIKKANRVPIEEVLGWLKQLHRTEVTGVVVHNDVVKDSYLVTYISDTMVCQLNYCDPPPWFVYRVMVYHWGRLFNIRNKKENH